jgi:hypothetical protein
LPPLRATARPNNPVITIHSLDGFAEPVAARALARFAGSEKEFARLCFWRIGLAPAGWQRRHALNSGVPRRGGAIRAAIFGSVIDITVCALALRHGPGINNAPR